MPKASTPVTSTTMTRRMAIDEKSDLIHAPDKRQRRHKDGETAFKNALMRRTRIASPDPGPGQRLVVDWIEIAVSQGGRTLRLQPNIE